MRLRNVLMVVALAFFVTGLAQDGLAQGIQTATIRGTVKDQQGLLMPGVTVTATSPALQRARSVVSDAGGNFAFRGLPAGDYEVKFELSGFAPVTVKATVSLGLTVEEDVTMRVAGAAQEVQ